MSETLRDTKYGFIYGCAEVQRTMTLPNGGTIIAVGSPKTGKCVHVYVSPGGRSIRTSDGRMEQER